MRTGTLTSTTSSHKARCVECGAKWNIRKHPKRLPKCFKRGHHWVDGDYRLTYDEDVK